VRCPHYRDTHQSLGIAVQDFTVSSNAVNVVLGEWRRKAKTPCHVEQNANKNPNRIGSDDFVSLPTCGLHVRKVFGWMRLFRVPIFTDIRVRIFFLVEIAESMIDFAVFTLICTD
jgi:hypothetical protein